METGRVRTHPGSARSRPRIHARLECDGESDPASPCPIAPGGDAGSSPSATGCATAAPHSRATESEPGALPSESSDLCGCTAPDPRTERRPGPFRKRGPDWKRRISAPVETTVPATEHENEVRRHLDKPLSGLGPTR